MRVSSVLSEVSCREAAMHLDQQLDAAEEHYPLRVKAAEAAAAIEAAADRAVTLCATVAAASELWAGEENKYQALPDRFRQVLSLWYLLHFMTFVHRLFFPGFPPLSVTSCSGPAAS